MRTASAIVPTLGTAPERLRRTVDAVLAQRTAVELDVIVVINAAHGSPHIDLPEHVRVVEAGANLGWAGGLHLGRAVTNAELLWLIQDDLEPDPHCLDALVTCLTQNEVSLASPVVVVNPEFSRDGAIIGGSAARHSLGALLDRSVFTRDTPRDGVMPDGSTGILVERFPHDDVPLDELRVRDDLDYVPSRGMLLHATTWDAVEGMDPRNYPVGASDVEFCLALRSANFTFAIAADARVTHEKSASTPRSLARVVARTNRRRVVATWRDGAERRAVLATEIPAAVRDAVLVGATEAVAALSEELERITEDRDHWRTRARSL